MKILGVSCYYHDSAACLVEDGVVVAAAQEERFTRVKHDESFPENAVRYCLAEGGVAADGLDAAVFYDKPLLKFHRILETYLTTAPRGLGSFVRAIPVWLREKLWIPPRFEESLEACGVVPPQLLFTEHHEAHAASAFFPSPFEEAAILTLDGVGEWATTTLGVGRGRELSILQEIDFPHSLGLLYSAFTYFTGFKVNSGEYKLMGLAPYGEPVYADRIRDHLIDLKDDGSFRLDLDYFGYLDGLEMTNRRFADLFDGPARKPESPLTRREMDLARSIQVVTEEAVLRLARHARSLTGLPHLCLAGGVALNCVANGKLLREGVFDHLWIQPAAGDAGGALGAALAAYHGAFEQPRHPRESPNPEPGDGLPPRTALACPAPDHMAGAALGPAFPADEIRAFLDHHGYPYREPAAADWADDIAALLADERVVGLFQGRMEFGPRALGHRSILGDPRSPKMQSVMNLKIKFRESFRPFAPSVLEERVSDYFELDEPSPYMLLVADVHRDRRLPPRGDERDLPLKEWVNRPRSDVPAVTHVDGSARVQSVSAATDPAYHAILEAFEARTGYGLVVNTSFNVRGEPIVCTPEDAYRCFRRTGMDHLVLGPFILDETDQPPLDEAVDWREEFALD